MSGSSCSLSENRSKCNCTYEPCSRKGRCCECIAYHWGASKELPACFFPEKAERSYDRSLAHFLALWKDHQ